MNNEPTNEPPRSLPSYAHVIAGWPLLMIFVGGALGGLCAGAAYGLSIAILKKRGVTPLSCFLSVMIGIVGIGLYFIVLIGLAIAFPEMFGSRK